MELLKVKHLLSSSQSRGQIVRETRPIYLPDYQFLPASPPSDQSASGHQFPGRKTVGNRSRVWGEKIAYTVKSGRPAAVAVDGTGGIRSGSVSDLYTSSSVHLSTVTHPRESAAWNERAVSAEGRMHDEGRVYDEGGYVSQTRSRFVSNEKNSRERV